MSTQPRTPSERNCSSTVKKRRTVSQLARVAILVPWTNRGGAIFSETFFCRMPRGVRNLTLFLVDCFKSCEMLQRFCCVLSTHRTTAKFCRTCRHRSLALEILVSSRALMKPVTHASTAVDSDRHINCGTQHTTAFITNNAIQHRYNYKPPPRPPGDQANRTRASRIHGAPISQAFEKWHRLSTHSTHLPNAGTQKHHLRTTEGASVQTQQTPVQLFSRFRTAA